MPQRARDTGECFSFAQLRSHQLISNSRGISFDDIPDDTQFRCSGHGQDLSFVGKDPRKIHVLALMSPGEVLPYATADL